jgi:hypothetical protein
MDYICGKRLQPMLPELLTVVERYNEFRCDRETLCLETDNEILTRSTLRLLHTRQKAVAYLTFMRGSVAGRRVHAVVGMRSRYLGYSSQDSYAHNHADYKKDQ